MARNHDDGLGPDSMLWHFLADRRYLFVLPRAVCLLLLDPGIAAGITDHALMRKRIWLHKKRTFTQAVNYAFADDDMSPQMRFSHEHVKGVDDTGRKYHALNPDTFHFQHAAYVESLFYMVETFIRPLDADDREQLYAECCAWYRRYGISTRPMPASWPEFGEYFEDYCGSHLMAGPHFEPFREQIFAPTDWWMRAVPQPAIRAMQHPRALELTGTTVGVTDRWSLRQFVLMTQLSTLTPRHHWNARARTALRKAAHHRSPSFGTARG
ncbi:oxygenase MpaB family protein [[Mycobacterium] kokjensenii]|uniref:Oxygenase MpaB family protein n=1 Tax=[Mycobacterium] kokjensenii TaxID=3064287 RepID=A0ABN9NAQ1_9MYCO|nr:oxygenase MpaB family protein [Mycolicibacter sp. MU0083]CAJ1501500.1 oxygenase MpaB family protein [Mycolicibacter sp. MU0083]